ncbi:swr complex subunit [Coemansia sp. RSA 552]|nr:swr complex subunit [Coemansia sp. RSA 552]
MSLADLYRNDQPSGSSDSSEDEFVPSDGSASADEGASSGSDGEEAGGAEQQSEPTEEQRQQSKRRIDSIWQRMNEPDSPGQDTAPVEGDASAKGPEELPVETSDDNKALPGAPTEEDSGAKGPEEPPAKRARAPPPGRRRRASKFSQLAERVEQRRQAKKANTLETARKAWMGFVDAEGIRDDLDRANKDGFVERQEFLGRVDQRTYERARERRK